jgi:isocitrate/isopropylmalate dehydrogenase
MTEAGDAVENAVNETITAGVRTPDIAGDLPPATTDMFGDEVAARI